MTVSCFLGLFYLLLLTVHASNFRGVPPSLMNQLSGETFKCLDGSKTIPINAVNDDYCDCNDGSDEPGTAACPNGKFYCKNVGHVPHTIFASRVNDGICDCCDGSDEFQSPSACKDTCKEVWEEATKIIRADIEEHVKGIQLTKQHQANYHSLVNEKKNSVSEKQNKKSTLVPQQDELKSKKEILQKQIDEKTEELRQTILAHIDPDVQARYEANQAKAEEDARLAAEAKLAAEASAPPDADQPTETEKKEDVPPPAELSEEEKQKNIDQEKENIRKELVDQKLNENADLTSLKNEMANLDIDLTRLNNEVSDVDRDINDLNHFLNFDFGPDARFAYLNEQSYSVDAAEYTYTIKPFKDVTQGHTRVGSWGSWANNYSEMKYENGERCWGGPDRSMMVQLVCGADTVIGEVKEPNKCEYWMKMKTPGACTAQNLEILKNKLEPL